MSYKRKLTEKTINFYPPDKDCYACYDTGIVNNSDRLVNRLYWHDYDIDEKGRKFAGSDAAIICHCKKAYQQLDEEQNVITKEHDRPEAVQSNACKSQLFVSPVIISLFVVYLFSRLKCF